MTQNKVPTKKLEVLLPPISPGDIIWVETIIPAPNGYILHFNNSTYNSNYTNVRFYDTTSTR